MIISATIGEILGHKGGGLWSITPEATVFEAIQLMSERNIGAVLVMQGQQLVGVLSERDYTRKVALKGRSSKEMLVREILTHRDVDVNHVNNLGWTALLEAIILSDDGVTHQQIVQLLVDHGADTTIADKDGVTPLQHARPPGVGHQARFARRPSGADAHRG